MHIMGLLIYQKKWHLQLCHNQFTLPCEHVACAVAGQVACSLCNYDKPKVTSYTPLSSSTGLCRLDVSSPLLGRGEKKDSGPQRANKAEPITVALLTSSSFPAGWTRSTLVCCNRSILNCSSGLPHLRGQRPLCNLSFSS